jgi:hypothetical protein
MKPTDNTKDNIEYFFEALESPTRDLSKWEDNFLDSIREQFEERGSLSDRQFEILERIYAEKTA